jgi:MFS family permease
MPSYAWLLVVAVLTGLGNAVYHPADYAILGAAIAPDRVGRAFSIHTFSGFLGGAIAPVVILSSVAFAGFEATMLLCAVLGVLAALPLLLSADLDRVAPPRPAAAGAARRSSASPCSLPSSRFPPARSRPTPSSPSARSTAPRCATRTWR